MQFLGTGTTGWHEFKIDVADVAEGTDFFMMKPITRYSSTSLTNIRIGKFGQGTMEIQDTIDVIKGVYIYGGAFKLAGSHLTDASEQKFALSGGTLAAADDTENSCGPLAVTARGGKIKLGEGATLTFASFEPEAGAVKKSIMIDAPLRANAIRFTTVLTGEQRTFFRWKDDTAPSGSWRVCQDASGYLHPVMQGTVLIIR